MSDNQSDAAKKATARYIMVMGGFGTVTAAAHIAWIGSFAILEYAGLTLGLVALIGGFVMMLAAGGDGKPKGTA